MVDEKNNEIENNADVIVAEDIQVAELDELTQQMIAALEGRAAFYDFLAAVYYLPLKAEQIENIAAMDLSAYADVNELFAEGLNDMTRYLNKRNTGTRQELAVDFTSAFAGTNAWKGKYAVPYESVFTSEGGLLFQNAYHEVFRLYRENRVARKEGYDFPDDHLSFMFEFLVILSNRAVEALKAGDKATAYQQFDISRKFIHDHILSWFDPFQELALCLLKTRFYRGILKVTKGFVQFDDQLLSELMEETEEK